MIIFRLSENNILKFYPQPQHYGVNECLCCYERAATLLC